MASGDIIGHCSRKHKVRIRTHEGNAVVVRLTKRYLPLSLADCVDIQIPSLDDKTAMMALLLLCAQTDSHHLMTKNAMMALSLRQRPDSSL